MEPGDVDVVVVKDVEAAGDNFLGDCLGLGDFSGTSSASSRTTRPLIR